MEFKLEKWQANYIDDFMAATDDPNLSDNLCEIHAIHLLWSGFYHELFQLSTLYSVICFIL